MPLTVITDPQLASYIGIPVGGLAIDQRAEGGGIIGFHGAPSDLAPNAYTPDVVAAIITSLPALPSLQFKLNILLAIIKVDGQIGQDWNARPYLHPLYGFLWSAYLVSEAQGDALAAVWPSRFVATRIRDTAGRLIGDTAGRDILDTVGG